MSNFKLKQNGEQVQKAIDYALQVPQLSEAIVDQDTRIQALEDNPSGATEEQIQQIETNKNDIADIKGDLAELSQIEAPKIVSSVDEMTDTTKHYVNRTTGTIWASMKVTTGGEVIKTPNFTNLFDKSAVTLNSYLTGSGIGSEDGSFTTNVMPFNKATLSKPQVIRIANWNYAINHNKRDKIQWLAEGAYNSNLMQQLNSITLGGITIDTSNIDLQTIICADGAGINSGSALTNKIDGFLMSFRVGASAITLDDIPDDMIITVNEEITYTETTTPIESIIEWHDTGIPYAPTFKTDLVGVLGEDNVIYLSDNLPSGTYTLKYPDDNYTTVGTISK